MLMEKKNGSITLLEQLKPDSKNANKGSVRGRGIIEKSLRSYGAGRSIVVDLEGNVIAGNQVLDVAADLDIPLRVVQTNGNELVVVQRTDLNIDSPEGRGLAIADNRANELSLNWDIGVLEDLSMDVDLTEYWHPEELSNMYEDVEKQDEESFEKQQKECTCPGCGLVFSV
tara:strand:- start:13365 stop:13877 length:513 start_codon:yes stop_codon:yes gene_type:complete